MLTTTTNYCNLGVLFGVLLLIIFNVSLIQGQPQPLQFSYNGHYYKFYDINVTYPQAQAACQQTPHLGLDGYLATVSTELEWKFILDFIFPQTNSANPMLRAWLSGSAKDAGLSIWTYDDGPEKGTIIYDLNKDRCYSYCPWSLSQPNNLIDNNYLNVLARDNRINSWDGNPLNAGGTGYICEYGGKYEPILQPATVDDTYIVLSNVLGTYVNSPTFQVQFTRLGATDKSPGNVFSCSPKYIGNGQANCYITPNSGVFNVTLINLNTTTTLYQFQPPYIAYIYPPTSTDPKVTVVGANFGVSVASSLTVGYSLSVLPCNNVEWFQNYTTVFVCTPSGALQDFTPTLLPITVNINGVSWGSRKSPWFYAQKQRFYTYNGANSDYANALSVAANSYIRQSPGHLGVIYDETMFNFAMKINTFNVSAPIPYVFWVPAVLGLSDWVWTSGPYNGQSTPVYTPNYPPSITQGNIYTFNALTKTFTPIPMAATSSYTFIEFGDPNPSWNTSGATYFSSTSGEWIDMYTKNDGHLFSNVTFATQIITLEKQNVPPYGLPSVKTPPFYGGPYAINFYVNGVLATGTQYIQYRPPTISDISRISKLGGWITVTGNDFYSDTTVLTVTLTNTSTPLSTLSFLTPHTKLLVQVPPLSPAMYSLSISLGGQGISGQFEVVNPTINFVTTLPARGVISISGKGFTILDNTPPVLMFGQLNVTQFISYNDTSIVANLPVDVKIGTVIVAVGSLVSNEISAGIVPYISSFGPMPSVNGGMFTISGRYLAPVNQSGNPVRMEVQFSKPSVINPMVNCSVLSGPLPSYQIGCPIQPGTGKFNIQFYYDQFSVTSNSQYQPPTIDSTTSIDYNTTGMIEVFGSNFADVGLSVTIDNITCTSTVVIDSTRLTCFLDAVGNYTNNNANGMGKEVVVTVDTLVGKRNAFFYNIYKQCLPPCDTLHGTCNNRTGVCDCQSGWTGYNCSSVDGDGDSGTKLPPVIGESGGSIIPGQGFNFSVSLSYLREVDLDGNQVKLLAMSDIKWTNRTSLPYQSTNITSKERFNGHFPNDTCFVQLDLTIFSESDTIMFAGQPIVMPSNSIKYEITISNWTFINQLSSLEAIYSAITDKQTSFDCEDRETSYLNDQNDNIAWFEIYTGGATMRAKFADRVIVDNRYFTSRVSVLPDSDPLYSNIGTTDHFQVLAAITVPNFVKDTILDPNFGSLVKISNKDCSTKNQWKIPVIVVCSVVGAAAITCAIIFIMKKKHISFRTISRSIRMSRV